MARNRGPRPRKQNQGNANNNAASIQSYIHGFQKENAMQDAPMNEQGAGTQNVPKFSAVAAFPMPPPSTDAPSLGAFNMPPPPLPEGLSSIHAQMATPPSNIPPPGPSTRAPIDTFGTQMNNMTNTQVNTPRPSNSKTNSTPTSSAARPTGRVKKNKRVKALDVTRLMSEMDLDRDDAIQQLNTEKATRRAAATRFEFRKPSRRQRQIQTAMQESNLTLEQATAAVSAQRSAQKEKTQKAQANRRQQAQEAKNALVKSYMESRQLGRLEATQVALDEELKAGRAKGLKRKVQIQLKGDLDIMRQQVAELQKGLKGGMAEHAAVRSEREPMLNYDGDGDAEGLGAGLEKLMLRPKMEVD